MPEKSFCFEESPLPDGQLQLQQANEICQLQAQFPEFPQFASEEHKSAAIKTTPGGEVGTAGEEEESRGRCEDDARTEQNIDAYRHDRSVCRIETGGIE